MTDDMFHKQVKQVAGIVNREPATDDDYHGRDPAADTRMGIREYIICAVVVFVVIVFWIVVLRGC